MYSSIIIIGRREEQSKAYILSSVPSFSLSWGHPLFGSFVKPGRKEK